MTALDLRARRFRQSNSENLQDHDETLFEEAIDETGTLRRPSAETEEEFLQQNLTTKEWEDMQQVDDYLTTVHGVAPGKKQEGIGRLILENVNGLSTRISGNEKLEKGKALIDDLEPDIVAITEHRINHKHKKNRNGLRQMFDGGEADIRAIQAHNVHENVSKVQEGGTGILAFGPITEQLDHLNSGSDETGLGRWSYMRFTGKDGVSTYVLSGYNPCYNKKKHSGTTYQQHRRFFINNMNISDPKPRKKFRDDLLKLLKKWRAEGNRIIVCLDANQDIYLRSGIGDALTSSDEGELGMTEVIGNFTGQKLGATFFRGSKPIDGIWATTDIEISNACLLPVGMGMGDHRILCIDFSLRSVVGENPHKIVRMKARRVNSNIPSSVSKYSKSLEENLTRHRLIERLGLAHSMSRSSVLVKEKLDVIDEEAAQYMKHAEKTCRRIKSGRIPFSPEATMWIKRTGVYRSLLRYHAGKKVNASNLRRAARRCGIDKPFLFNIYEVRARLKICKDKCHFFRKHGHRYRRQHLHERLRAAQNRRDVDAEQSILRIIEREKQRSLWRRLNYSMFKQKGRSVRSVKVPMEGGGVMEFDGQRDVESAIWSEVHKKRFHLAEEAPICQGRLRGEFGYNAVTPSAAAVLAGTYVFPPDFHQATKELMQEIARIRSIIPEDSVECIIKKEAWQYRWSKAREATSSSESGLHFGHYMAGVESDTISHFHALKASIALLRGVSLSRWSRGLSVMLEKEFGNTLVTKLRAILLMEADFNTSNKIIFGDRMLDNARKYNLVHEEIFSEKGRMAEDGALAKTLLCDISRQFRAPLGIASVDASNCYDRVAHAIASLVFQAFGVPANASTAMLTAIQQMQFFLRTAYGDSSNCAQSTVEVKTQGLCQGNGAAPAGWAVISIAILGAHKKNGHGAHFLAPVSATKMDLSAILYVDDTDIIHLDMENEETVSETHAALQSSVLSWGNLLIATGGTLKPEKCFYYLMSYEFNERTGAWKYANNHELEEFALRVPMPSGDMESIQHLAVTDPRKMLGASQCPAGTASGSIALIQERAQQWVDQVMNGTPNRRQVWFSMDHQLSPKIEYGLCCNTGTIDELQECIQKQLYQVIPKGGLIRTVPRKLRDLNRGFYGGGAPNIPTAVTVAQIKKLLMHYGCPSSVGLLMQTSMEGVVVESGLSANPFQLDYQRFGHLVTPSWFKTVWEKMDHFNFQVKIHNINLSPPRGDNDEWLMVCFMEAGYSGTALHRLNRVRLHQQVLFLSDILTAGGQTLDEKYRHRRPSSATWSTLKFPKEKPRSSDFTLWRRAIAEVVPSRRAADRLRDYVKAPSKRWEWMYDDNVRHLLHLKGDGTMDVYARSQNSLARNQFFRVLQNRPQRLDGDYCSVEEVSPGYVRILSKCPSYTPPPPPSDFLEVLIAWNCEWMWESLKITGDLSWVEEAIADGSLVTVTDGSFIKELYPDLCSAAFVFECSKGRGRLFGSFPDHTIKACAYRGELLGLLAIHLILLAVNKVRPDLEGSVHIYSDCLGALRSVVSLPSDRIPSNTPHSDILKMIMIHCSDYTFLRRFSHVSAHQLDHLSWKQLTRAEQLNEFCDGQAKQEIWSHVESDTPVETSFPLEPLTIHVDGEKMTSGSGDLLQYHAARAQAKTYFTTAQTKKSEPLMLSESFEEIDWKNIYHVLHEVPRLFQLFACKQVHGVAGTNDFIHRYDKSRDPHCPSCTICKETTSHILVCKESNRQDLFRQSTENIRRWMVEVGTHPDLRDCIIEYIRGQGRSTLKRACQTRCTIPNSLGESQDRIGWRRFMEGMISKEFASEHNFTYIRGHSRLTGQAWARQLVQRLLEFTHGIWVYRNALMHDNVTGLLASDRKEDLLRHITEQKDLGEEGLAEEDRYLLEIKLDDLETSSGETQAYWLLAIKAARKVVRLRTGTETTASEEEVTMDEGPYISSR